MKKFFLILALMTIVASCGKSNNVNSGNTTGSNGLEASGPLVNFVGVYDIRSMGSEDCGAVANIVAQCNGYRVFTNLNHLGAEDFCHVNQNNNSRDLIVTQVGNQLKSTLSMGARSFTSSLTLEPNGVLVRISHFKARETRCVYQKR